MENNGLFITHILTTNLQKKEKEIQRSFRITPDWYIWSQTQQNYADLRFI